MKETSKKITFWTQARIERLQNLYNKYGSQKSWAEKISKQFKSSVSANAVYKKAARIGLSKPVWALKEIDRSATKKTKKA